MFGMYWFIQDTAFPPLSIQSLVEFQDGPEKNNDKKVHSNDAKLTVSDGYTDSEVSHLRMFYI